MKYNYLSLLLIINANVLSAPNIMQYRIYCNTESKNIYQWGQASPVACPNDTSHEVNLNSISIVDEQGPALFAIKEEAIQTGGHFRVQTETVAAFPGPNVTTILQYSWPFDISVLAIYMLADTSNAGDILSVTVGADTVYGILTQDVEVGATVLSVSASVINNIAKGFYVKIDNGDNSDDLGRVISVDSANSTITVEIATKHSYSALSIPQIKVSVRPIDAIELVGGLQYTLGMKKIGASYIPANTMVNVEYLNKTDVPKKLVLTYEYLY